MGITVSDQSDGEEIGGNPRIGGSDTSFVSSRGRGSEGSEKVGKSRAGVGQEDEFLVLTKVGYIHVHTPLSSQGFSLILDARTYARHSRCGRQMLHGFTQSGP